MGEQGLAHTKGDMSVTVRSNCDRWSSRKTRSAGPLMEALLPHPRICMDEDISPDLEPGSDIPGGGLAGSPGTLRPLLADSHLGGD